MRLVYEIQVDFELLRFLILLDYRKNAIIISKNFYNGLKLGL
jgi:hypothetical protein